MDDIFIELQEIANMDDYRMFCHFTDVPYDSILENGLYLEQDKWNTTLYEVREDDEVDERSNIKKFIIDQLNPKTQLSWKKTLIVVMVPSEYGYNFVFKSNIPFDSMDYLIPSEFILCGVDLENEIIEYNEDAIGYEPISYTR